ncbi:unnamed protein product [Caenorhabditis sp. 36 PRJEB53466]|nr:unnamed protein product [Caenorhabditis sp. 36 PRJEB53466]
MLRPSRCALLLLSLFHPVTNDTKMMKIFGTVLDASPSSAVSAQSLDSAAACIDACFDDDSCVLAAFSENSQACTLYSNVASLRMSVKESAQEEQTYVVFKTVLPDSSCPASYTTISFQAPTANDAISWSFDKTASTWTLVTCRDDWKRFEREDKNVVCMQAFPLPANSSKSSAEEYCVQLDTVLTGVDSVEETKWLQEQIPNMAETYENYAGLWIDGVRDCEGTCDYNYTASFTWSDGYTTGIRAMTEDNVMFSFEDE